MNTMGENINCTSIGLPPAQERFIEEVAKLKKPLIGLHFDGRPISSDAADKYLNALIECWLPSERGAKQLFPFFSEKNVRAGNFPSAWRIAQGSFPCTILIRSVLPIIPTITMAIMLTSIVRARRAIRSDSG